jgi:hypothetical protein
MNTTPNCYSVIESAPLSDALEAATNEVVIRLSPRQARVLAAVLVHTSPEGEGACLEPLYELLRDAGHESDDTWSGIDDGLVIVEANR